MDFGSTKKPSNDDIKEQRKTNKDRKNKKNRAYHYYNDNISNSKQFSYLLMVILYHFYESHCAIHFEYISRIYLPLNGSRKIDIGSTMRDIFIWAKRRYKSLSRGSPVVCAGC